MKKQLIILAVLLVVGICMLVNSCFTKPIPSRMEQSLSLELFAKEGCFAVEAVKLFYSNSSKFSKLWQSHGDIYNSSVRLLKKVKMHDPKIKKIFSYKSCDKKILVELECPGCNNIVVGVWKANGHYRLTEIYLAEEKADEK